MRKYFSVEEANALLPSIQRDIEELQRIKDGIDHKFMKVQLAKTESERFMIEAEIDFLQVEARTHMGNIHRQGAELKDIDIGLVDFPAVLGGEEVLLCWRLGEVSVAFYHSRESGYMGRKPIQDKDGQANQ